MRYLEIIKEFRLGYKDIMQQSEQNLKHSFGFELEIAIAEQDLEYVFQDMDVSNYVKKTFHFDPPTDISEFYDYMISAFDIVDVLEILSAIPKNGWADEEDFYIDNTRTKTLSVDDVDEGNLRKYFNVRKDVENLEQYDEFVDELYSHQFEEYKRDFDMSAYFVNNLNEKEKDEMIIDYICDVFKSKLNYKFKKSYAHNAGGKNYKEWNIEPDGSIEPIGGEIISPVFDDVTDGISSLKTMFEFIKNVPSFSTNDTTGLHINIGVPENIDLLKLFLFLGDNYMLSQFNRENITYAKQVFGQIYGFLHDNDLKNYNQMIKSVNSSLVKLTGDNAKYLSVNISKLNKGFLEFRIIGGENYHLRGNEILQIIMRYLKLIEVASDPNMERNSYLNKLYKMTTNKEEYKKQDQNRTKSRNLVELGVISKKDYGDIHAWFYKNLKYLDKVLIGSIDNGSRNNANDLISGIIIRGLNIDTDILKTLIRIVRYYKLNKNDLIMKVENIYNSENNDGKFEEYFQECMKSNIKNLINYAM